ncbi:MAG: CD225/dispanin family protein, partial [Bacteroidales bacterium]|nr:CD225/dispanin family protein [Candidatus Sodaliphilus limicaballi]
PVGGYAAPAYVQPPVQQPTGPMPKTYLAESIGIMLCCCQIFGIIGLVHASGVSSAYNAGRYAEAEQKSQDAKKWVKYGLIAGVVQYLLLGIFYFVYFFILIGAAASGY